MEIGSTDTRPDKDARIGKFGSALHHVCGIFGKFSLVDVTDRFHMTVNKIHIGIFAVGKCRRTDKRFRIRKPVEFGRHKQYRGRFEKLPCITAILIVFIHISGLVFQVIAVGIKHSIRNTGIAAGAIL